VPSLRTFALVIVASATMPSILATTPAGASSASSSGSSLMKKTLTAVGHEHSVHVAATTKTKTSAGKPVALTIATDVGKAVGIEHVTFEQGGGTGHEIIEEVKGIGYLRGDAFSLQNFNGFPASDASKYKMKWISMTKSDSYFAELTAGLLMSTFPEEIKMPSPKLLAGTQKVAGVRVKALRSTVVSGSSKITGTLYIRATGASLPVGQKFTESGGSISAVSYSGWNESVRVSTPRSSVPLSSLES
jgi:hypothetical protein